jgi:hypothetical protein
VPVRRGPCSLAGFLPGINSPGYTQRPSP